MAAITKTKPRLILRYRPSQRLVHWLGVTAVAALLITGLALVVRPLAFLAYSGISPYIHRVAAVVFMALPLVYVLANRHAFGDLLKESFTYTRADWQWLRHFLPYAFGHAEGLPSQGRLNAGQKLHHAATFIAFVVVTLSGLILWFAKGSLEPTQLAVAAMAHDVSMFIITVLLIGHVYFTFVYDALPGMTTGYVTEDYARMEHTQWVESLPEFASHPAAAADTVNVGRTDAQST